MTSLLCSLPERVGWLLYSEKRYAVVVVVVVNSGGSGGSGGSVARILLHRQWSVGPKHQAGNEPHNAEVQAASGGRGHDQTNSLSELGAIDGLSTICRCLWTDRWIYEETRGVVVGAVGWNGSEDVGRRNTNRRESECWTYDRNYRSDLTLTVVQRAFDI
ncbi:hypothetical protein V1478_015128 [Vespula squamosa]|uniref:Uncharacterized protein n=1 Tax=Vespula squamosa TaxID=30214 RepID=A0ABD2A6S3_VESSQ